MSAYEQILYEVTDRVATVTLNRPEKLNAWTMQMEQEVSAAIQAAAQRVEGGQGFEFGVLEFELRLRRGQVGQHLELPFVRAFQRRHVVDRDQAATHPAFVVAQR